MSKQQTTPIQKEITQNKGTRKQYTDRSGKSGRISPAIVEKFLAGMHYPAEKKKLIENAPDDILKVICKLPEKTYTSPIDITKEMGKMN